MKSFYSFGHHRPKSQNFMKTVKFYMGHKEFYSKYKLNIFNHLTKLIYLKSPCKCWTTFKTFASYVCKRTLLIVKMCIRDSHIGFLKNFQSQRICKMYLSCNVWKNPEFLICPEKNVESTFQASLTPSCNVV